MILPVVLFGCKTWPLIIKRGMQANGIQKQDPEQVSGPKRDDNGL